MRRLRAERFVSDVLSNNMCRRAALVNTMQRSLFLGNLGILVVKDGMSLTTDELLYENRYIREIFLDVQIASATL